MPSRDRDPIQRPHRQLRAKPWAGLPLPARAGGANQGQQGMPPRMGLPARYRLVLWSQRGRLTMALVTQHVDKQAYLGPGVLIVYGQQGQAILTPGCRWAVSVRVPVS